ncbi:uncharacterized protein V6R79_008845 [Siganus canaliculatus]
MSESKSSQRFHSLNAEQVEVLHQVLSEVVPIHGRGNFPTLELRPRDIIIAVRARLQKLGITVRDVRLNGSTASHVLIRDNGTSYKDLDIIFGVELPSQEEFQVIKESVLGCLLDCLPAGVNKERISSATMKEAYVQKMVKVFNEHDRWSLISLSNNSGKNLELKFVSALRRQFEFSVDSFQIILDRLLESYMQQDSQHKRNTVEQKDRPVEKQRKDSPSLHKQAKAPETEAAADREVSSKEAAQISQTQQKDEELQTKLSQQGEQSEQVKQASDEEDSAEKTPAGLKDMSTSSGGLSETDSSDQTSLNLLSEERQTSEAADPPSPNELNHEPELLDKTTCSAEAEQSEQTQPAHSDHKELLSAQKEQPDHAKPPDEQEELTEQMGQSEPPKTSNDAQTETQKLAEERHDSAGVSACCSEDQRNDEQDKTQHVSAPDLSSSSHVKAEAQLADEKREDTGTRERREEREDEVEVNEVTEDNSASEGKEADDTQGINCSCSTSSVSLTLDDTQPTGMQDALEIHSTLHTDSSDKTANADTADTQDSLPAPPSLVSDKKSLPSPFCKTSERLSHMVVLKHSSPKPPRRMCRKVTPNHGPSPVSESETVTTPCLDPNPCTSLDPELSFNLRSAESSSDPTTVTSASVSAQTDHRTEPDSSSDLASSPDLSSATDPAPDISSTSGVDPVSGLTLEPSSSQLVTESSCETNIQSPAEMSSPHEAFDEQSPPLPPEAAPEPQQPEPDSEDVLVSHAETSSSSPQKPVDTSEPELSDEDENRKLQTKTADLNQPDHSPQDATLSSPSSSHCVTPPVLSLSPACVTPSPPSLIPPPCLTPPSTSLSSPPLSFSPTSSCLSSPAYLTPPMLSLSPPPLCLSPPLLCLTPPVESEDLAPQVSSDMEPLILSTDSEKQIKETSAQAGTVLLQLEDEKEQDYISSLPQVAEPASFPITIPSSSSQVLPPSPSPAGSLGESAPSDADEASSSVPDNKEVPKVNADMSGQSDGPQASDLPPAVEVLAESMYGDFEAAMDHLRYRLIATRNPEEIRGGGLLKYSNLLVRDYRPASETQIKTLERYMCSRFFIDFPDVQEQQRKILSYLKNHFIGEERSKYQYLMTLRRVVDDSTVCLMGHERRQTLNMITVLALKVLGEQNIIPNTDHVTCFYQPAPYLAEHSAPYMAEPSYCSYYIPQGGSTLLYQPYPLHLHTQTGLV